MKCCACMEMSIVNFGEEVDENIHNLGEGCHHRTVRKGCECSNDALMGGFVKL